MSIIIKGIEMPTSCFDTVLLCNDGRVFMYKNGGWVNSGTAVPVQPHGRLIDVDALEQDAQKRLLMCNKNDDLFQKPYEIMRAIALAPTIIPAEEAKT